MLTHYVSGKCYRCIRMAPLQWQQQLLMASCRPIIILEDAAGKLGLAHCSCWSYFRCFHVGLLFFWDLLPMHQDGPISVAGADFYGCVLAHYVSGRCCR